MPGQHLLTDRLLCQSQPKLAGLQSYVLIGVLCPLQHVLQEIKRKKKKKRGTLSITVNQSWVSHFQDVSRPPTWMMLCMWGMRRSMRTSSNMTRARHTFFRTSESSSAARANRLYTRISIWYNKGLHDDKKKNERETDFHFHCFATRRRNSPLWRCQCCPLEPGLCRWWTG